MSILDAKSMIVRYEERYGKLTYGVITLLVLWYALIQPMQASNVQIAVMTEKATANLVEMVHAIERGHPSTQQARSIP